MVGLYFGGPLLSILISRWPRWTGSLAPPKRGEGRLAMLNASSLQPSPPFHRGEGANRRRSGGIVAEGPPEKIVHVAGSHTGHYLKSVLA